MKQIRLQRILLITLVMTFIGGLQSLYDHAIITSIFSAGSSELYRFNSALVFNMVSGFGGGLIAAITLNFIDIKFRSKPYYQSLFILIAVFMSVWAVRNIVEGVLLVKQGEPFRFSFDGTDVKNIVFWMLIVILTYFLLEMNNKFGPGKLQKIFLGKFNTPVEEQRIFMFLDLKSSTTIAEQMDGIRYHLFLKKLFSDVTAPILRTHGEIYQYVGDEIVLTWELNQSENLKNYIQCFFDIEKLLIKEGDKFERLFGAKPQFKAGAHYGTVIAGEIGVIKRDITYSGDILNTTARIQGMCNELQSNFLISKELFELSNVQDASWSFEKKGKISLKGKKEVMELMRIYINRSLGDS